MKQRKIVVVFALGIVLVGGGAFIVFQKDTAQQPVPLNMHTQDPILQIPKTSPSTKHISAQEILDVHQNFKFTAEMPNSWQAEAVPATQAIALFDPSAEGDSNLEKSQIFIRFFSANSFLTLSTVTIYNKDSLQINDRPAVRYDIEKKASIPNFSGQPTWRNKRHIVTDIRVSDTSPSVFYIIAKRPDLDEKIYEQFLQSLGISEAKTSEVVNPVADFKQRITKKFFGTYVTSNNSPVQPEKFTGYHTGVDVEYGDVDSDVPVYAIADGAVLLAKLASGYGGVIAIQHKINNQPVIAIYGHVNPNQLPKVGQQVKQGDQMSMLGKGYSKETDGERKHLHFGLVKGTTVNLLGYVPDKSQLSAWLDPMTVF